MYFLCFCALYQCWFYAYQANVINGCDWYSSLGQFYLNHDHAGGANKAYLSSRTYWFFPYFYLPMLLSIFNGFDKIILASSILIISPNLVAFLGSLLAQICSSAPLLPCARYFYSFFCALSCHRFCVLVFLYVIFFSFIVSMFVLYLNCIWKKKWKENIAYFQESVWLKGFPDFAIWLVNVINILIGSSFLV